MKAIHKLSIVAIASLLAACGGGDSATSSSTQVPASAAVISLKGMQTPVTMGSSAAVVTQVHMALYGQAPSAAAFNGLISRVDASNGFAYASSLVATDFANMSDSDLATRVLTNMGVTSATVTAFEADGRTPKLTTLRNALVEFFGVFPTLRGTVILNLSNILATMESDSTWGVAAAAYNINLLNNYDAALGSTLVHSVPDSGYAPGSSDYLAFQLINTERDRCGFGKLTHVPALDVAARNHAHYMNINLAALGNDPHIETPGKVGFTAVYPGGRAKMAGYYQTVTENGSFANSTANLDLPLSLASPYNSEFMSLRGVKALFNAPYHQMNGIFSEAADVGIGHDEIRTVGPYTITPWPFNSLGYYFIQNYEQFNGSTYLLFGYKGQPSDQQPPQGTIRTYPCEGTPNVVTNFAGEWSQFGDIYPNKRDPVSGKWLYGSAIMVFGDWDKTLELTSAKITNLSTNIDMPIFALRTRANDPAPEYYSGMTNQGYITPDEPYAPNTRYRVVITGKNGATPFTKTFTFTSNDGTIPGG